ncbi:MULTISPECIES: hypothetical protein [unclassified Mameliella]|uniref:hypothetical protein n=1 Tax=unclassified Mameliella TaxID=2630630 RepID=UPI00273E6D00|nr:MULTISPECIES: hypothetical protein [unclassified Mameliella]
MISPFDTRFFATLAEVAAQTLDPQDSYIATARKAARTGAPEDLRAARRGLDDLPAEQRDRLMAETHRRLATDLSAIWDQMPGAPSGGRMN